MRAWNKKHKPKHWAIGKYRMQCSMAYELYGYNRFKIKDQRDRYDIVMAYNYARTGKFPKCCGFSEEIEEKEINFLF